ncbi:alpha/beta fold hydrolase [Nocardia sp. NPDC004278]
MSAKTLLVLPGLTPGLSADRLVEVLRKMSTANDRHHGVDLLDLLVRADRTDRVGADGLAEELSELVDEARWGTVDVLAEGVSATVALRFASRYPDRVGRLILIAPVGYAQPLSGAWTTSGDLAQLVRQLYLGDPYTSDAAFTTLCGGSGLAVPDAGAAYRASTVNVDVKGAVLRLSDWLERGAFDAPPSAVGDGLRTIRVPVDLIWGRLDRVSGLDSAFYLNRRLKDAQLRIFGDCGHLVREQGGDRLVRHIHSLLAESDSAVRGGELYRNSDVAISDRSVSGA